MTFQSRKRLGELLVEEEKIKEQDLQRALNEQKKYGQKLGQVLFRMGLLSEQVVAEALGRQLGIPVAKLDETDLPGDLISLIPKNIARNCSVIPIERHYNWIRVAMTDPLNIDAMDEVAHFLRLEVLPSVATESEINRALERYYGMGSQVESREEKPTLQQEPVPETVDQPETRPLQFLISQALSLEATDIHVEEHAGGGYIRMRIDGRLKMIKSPSLQGKIADLIDTIKAAAGLEKTASGPREGRLDSSHDMSARVSTFPTVSGERIALRLVDKKLSSGGFDTLGMASDLEEGLRKTLKQPGGRLVLCAGPAGSGKTTTLYTIINYLNAMDRAIVTIEDPIEYVLDHVAQTQVDPATGLSIGQAVRAMFRQDPDVCVLGEMKDSEIAHLVLQTAPAGAPVLSTFSCHDAVGALARLLDMGLDPSLLASSVACIIGQRLIRKICEDCREAYIPPMPVLESINVQDSVPLYRGNGCPACGNTGYRGRTAVFELLIMDDGLKNAILSEAPRAIIEKAAAANGMKTMREDALSKALLGITTLEEALNRTR